MSAGFRAGSNNDGYLQINGTDILSVSSGVLGIKNTGTQSEVRLFCESNNAHYASIKSPSHSDFIGNVTFTLPGTAGSSGQVLQTDGSGNLSWVNQSGGGGGGGVSDKMSEGNTEAEVVDTGTDGHFKVTTEGSERLRITSAGSVGIGTDSPNFSTFGSNTGGIEISDVDSNNALLVQSSSNELYFGNSSLTNFIWGASNTPFAIATNNTERLRIDSAGRLMAGTTTEGHADADDLTLQASSGYTGITLRSATDQGGAIYFSDATSGLGEYDGQIVYSQNSRSLSFATAGANRLLIGPAGQIGISGANYGTSGQVLTSGGASGAVSWTTISGGGGYGDSQVDTHLNTSAASSGQILSWNGSDYAWVADQTGGGGSSDKISEGNTEAETVDTGTDGHFKVTTEGTERLRVQKGGNVVIGTTVEETLTSFRTLHIHGDYTRIKLTDQFSGTGTSDGLDIQCSGGSVYHKFYENGSVYFSTNNTNRFQLTHDGNVKILTSGGMLDGNGSLIMSVSGTERLRVGSAGQIGIGGANYGTAGQVLTSGGASGAVSWTTVSGGGGISNVVEDTTPQLGGNLDVQANEINTSTTNGNIKLAPNGTGVVEVRGAGGGDGTLQLNCSAQSHGIKLKSPPHSAAASYTLTFPNSIVNGQYLKTDASGNLSWGPGASDQINEGNTTVEVVDTGSDGHIKMTAEGTEALRIDSDGHIRAYGDAGTSSIADSKASFATINAVVPSAGGTAALNVLSRGSGTQENIVLRSISTDGWAGAQFRAENYNFTIRTTNVLTLDFNGSAQFTGKSSPSGRNTRISQYGSLLVATTGELISNARCSIDSGNGNIITEGSIQAAGVNLQNSATSSWFQTGTSIATYPYVWAAKNSSTNVWHSGLQTDGDLYLGGNLAGTNNIALNGSNGSAWFTGSVAIGGNVAANTIDEYEEGTFDPTISPTSGSITLNSSYNTLSYTRIGRLVHISGQIRISSVSSPSGNTSITNLPFIVQSTTEQGRAGANCFYYDASAGSGNYYKSVPIHVSEGTTILNILNLHSLGGLNPAANDELTFAISYITSS